MSPETNRALQFLASMPSGHTTLPTKQLRELLLETGGQVMARGSLYDIKSRSLGAGVYDVSLKLWRERGR